MTAPDPDTAAQDIRQWRAAIDAFDDQILDLLRARLALAEEVGKTKAQGRLAWRPAREAQLFARLVAKAGHALSPHAVERLWSTIIAQSLQAQGPAFLLIPEGDAALQAQARSFFGLLPMQTVADASCAITRCAVEEGAIAVLPAPGPQTDWWLQLAGLNRTQERAPAVLAALPRFAADGPPSAFALATAPRERSGNDAFWYVLEGDMLHLPHAAVLAIQGDLRLVATNQPLAEAADGQACLIGLFAKPLHAD